MELPSPGIFRLTIVLQSSVVNLQSSVVSNVVGYFVGYLLAIMDISIVEQGSLQMLRNVYDTRQSHCKIILM